MRTFESSKGVKVGIQKQGANEDVVAEKVFDVVPDLRVATSGVNIALFDDDPTEGGDHAEIITNPMGSLVNQGLLYQFRDR